MVKNNFHVFVFKRWDFFNFRHENLGKKHVAVPQGIVFIIPKHNVKILKNFKKFQKSEKQYLILLGGHTDNWFRILPTQPTPKKVRLKTIFLCLCLSSLTPFGGKNEILDTICWGG